MTTYALDVEPLLAAGTSPAEISTRLGIQAGSVGRALIRESRPDLARPFLAERRRQQPEPAGSCACGNSTSRKSRQRCVSCGYRARDERARTR